MKDSHTEELLTAQELAPILNVKTRTVWGWKRAGKIDYEELPNGDCRFYLSRVLESHKAKDSKKTDVKPPKTLLTVVK